MSIAPHVRLVAVVLAGAAGLAVPVVAAGSTPPSAPEPVGSDHAQVIAQRIVTFGDGELRWQRTPLDVDADGSSVSATGPGFLVNPSGPPVLASAGDDSAWLLDTGQAVFRAAESTTDLSAPVEAPATLDQVSLETVTDDDAAAPDRFTPGAGPRDVELWRDVLAPGESLALTAEVSAFVMTTVGAVEVNGTEVAPASAASFAGELTVLNAGDEPVAVLLAVVGAPLVTSSSAPPTTTGVSTTVPTTAAPATTPPPAPTIDPTLDTDGDGLYDVDEIGIGTDPGAFDTDGDGLPDGDDLNSFGCDPLSSDTDGDGLDDALDELDYGLDCADPDVDGDGFDDGAEIAAGSDPEDPNSQP